MLDQLLAALTRYGPPALFIVVAVAALGVPLPVTLLLIITGSLVAQEAMNIWVAIAIAAAGSVVGDQLGFAIGRWGGKALVARFSVMLGSQERISAIELRAKRWGGAGVFFSRWLVTPFGSVDQSRQWRCRLFLASIHAVGFSWRGARSRALHLARPDFQRPCAAGGRDSRRFGMGHHRRLGRRPLWLEVVRQTPACPRLSLTCDPRK